MLAESQLELAMSQAEQNGIIRAQYEHAIAVLVGKPPADLSIKSKPLNKIPPSIPVQLPSSLLERRPDIAAAEREMAAANAKIGIAVSAYFPVLPITGAFGFLTNGFAPFLSANSLSYAVGPALSELIFDGGYRKATTKAARVHYDAQVATYRQTVLSAFQEVEDNMVSLRILKTAAENIVRAEKNAKQALEFIKAGYTSGTNSYADLIIAQNTVFQSEKSTADINGLQMTSAVGLIKSLGGGWEYKDLPAFK